jgi:hypothetical protein
MIRNETHYLKNCISTPHQRWLASEATNIQKETVPFKPIIKQPIEEYRFNFPNSVSNWFSKFTIANNLGELFCIKFEKGNCYSPQIVQNDGAGIHFYGIIPMSKEITIHLFNEWIDVPYNSVVKRSQYIQSLLEKEPVEHNTSLSLSPYSETDQQVLKRVVRAEKKTVQPGSAFFWNARRLWCSEEVDTHTGWSILTVL